MGVLSLVSMLLPFLLTELEQYKILSPAIGNLIAGIESAATPLISDATTATPVTATAILAAISAALKVIQAQTTVSPFVLGMIQALDTAIAAGLAASAVTAVVPGNLTPETPVA